MRQVVRDEVEPERKLWGPAEATGTRDLQGDWLAGPH